MKLFTLLTLLTILNIANAQDYQINFSLLDNFKNAEEITNRDSLIESQLNPAKKDPNPLLNWDKDKERRESAAYSEGTGTRGGGSGVLTIKSNGTENVELLDIYRAKNRQQFPLFFELDQDLLEINGSMNDPEAEAQKIYETVLERIKQDFPIMAKKVETTEKSIPFKNWIPTVSNLPIIDDFIGSISLGNNQKQIQIAYRRSNQIIYVETLYDKMDGLNRAALRLHEYLYANANQSSSVAIQRLVSLLLSKKILEPNFKDLVDQTLYDMKLNSLEMNSVLLPKDTMTTEEIPGYFNICGVIKKMDLDPIKKKITLQLNVNPNQLQLTRKDLKSENLNTAFFSKYLDKKLDGDELNKFLFSLYSAKAYLSGKYSYLSNPAQRTNLDIVCVNKITLKLTYLEVSQSIHKKKGDAELKVTLAEANYFKAHRNVTLNPTPLNHLLFISAETDLQLASIMAQRLSIYGSNLLSAEASELDGVRVKFK